MPWIIHKLSDSSVLSRFTGLVRRSHRRTRPVMWVAAGFLLAGSCWVLVTGLYARSELLAARIDLETLRNTVTAPPSPASAARGATDRRARTDAAARSAAAHAARAHRLTGGPAWSVAAHVPLAGGPLETVRGTAKAVDRLTGQVLPALVSAAGNLANIAGAGGGHLNLAELSKAAPALEQASRQMATARTETRGLPSRTWLPAVDRVRDQLLSRLDRIGPAVEDAATGARLLPLMLGADGPRRYFVVFQNPAEARGTGGMPGAYATMTADRGKLTLTEFGHDGAMVSARPKVDLGAEFTTMYGHNDAVNTWPNSNLSPHFPYAARIWSAAWLDKSGEHVDGVLALDPGALARLLAASGQARTTDGTVVSADNVVDISERTNYMSYADPLKRKAFLLDVARAAAGRLLTAADDPQLRPALLLGLYDVLGNGQMTVWSAHPNEQRELESRPVGGSLPQSPEPYAGLVVNNGAGTKLDYYLDRTLEWYPGRCTAAGREVTVKAVLANHAPPSGLPTYVTTRMDKPAYATRAGDNRLLVSYYATAGASLNRATIDGQTARMSPGVERGHPVYTFDVELPAGSSRTVVLHLLEPPADRAPTVLHQRLPRPLRATVRPSSGCRGD
ncbi:DUF4012 domain-containing protein [Streptomyces sp. NBC_01750]|uniref:DUF4012 domain-containing protein n=1 Tax=Streptomyces sp. NBC_01750 TaxID=2975928 RepID=UPI002DD982D3|nr:DUF4012 domain-containing protein [Streptomyces sp. NBC_01750]WSD34193.1 DUF4012 domain-containing protein [Streptomyces sp. NBC_01750]